jgi:O-antigen ligase
MKIRHVENSVLFLGAALALSGLDIYLGRTEILAGASAIGSSLCFLAITLHVFRKGPVVRSSPATRRAIFTTVIFYSLFILWALIGIAFSSATEDGWSALARYIVYPLAIVPIAAIGLRQESLKALQKAVLVALVIVAGSIVYDFFFPRTFSAGLRPGGILSNPNGAAQGVVMLLVAMALVGASRKMLLVAIPFAVFAVLVTLSRSGLILLCLGLVAIARMQGRLSKSQAVKLAFGGFILLGAFAFTKAYLDQRTNVTFASRWERISSLDNVVDLNDPRVVLLRQYLTAWTEHPILGAGTASSMSGLNGVLGATHNLYAKVLFENGAVGLALLGLAALSIFMRAGRAKAPRGLLLVIGILLAWGVFTNTLLDNRLAYFMAALVLLTTRNPAEEASRDDRVGT